MKTIQKSFVTIAVLFFPLLTFGSFGDISLTNTAMPNPGTVRKNLTYDMNVINNGPDTATNVKVTDTIPQGVTLVSATFNRPGGPPTPCSGTTTITCNIGTLGVGELEGAAVFIVVRPEVIGALTNTATTTSDGSEPVSATVETGVEAQVSDPLMEDVNLIAGTVLSGLAEPTGIAFLGDNDFLVLEKSTGKVKRVTNGILQGVVLTLPVNFASERGLLGIALHPDFQNNHYVYLYWTCRGPEAGADCDQQGQPTGDIRLVPLRGNRVDRFIWNGSSLQFVSNLIRLHSYQADAGQTLRGNHNGGKILFGTDGKLYIFIGDNGRRGWMQNVTAGVGPNGNDDQFGGPEPDDAHLTGVVLRLNDDGSTPEDNPFINLEASDLADDLQPRATPEVIANLHKVFAYGHRNGFGMAFDPATGVLWETENGDDSGSEIKVRSIGSTPARMVAGSRSWGGSITSPTIRP